MPRTRDVLRDEALAAQLSKLPPGTESWVRGGEVRIEPAGGCGGRCVGGGDDRNRPS